MVSAVGIFFIILFLLVVFGFGGWVAYPNLRARKLGLPAPTFASYFKSPSYVSPYTPRPRSESEGGIFGFIKSKLPGGGGGGGAQTRGRLVNQDDGAWDARGYYEEDAELGLGIPGRGGTGGEESPPRGRSRSRSPRYSVEDQRAGRFVGQQSQHNLGQQPNPFGDEHEARDGFGGPVGVKGVYRTVQ